MGGPHPFDQVVEEIKRRGYHNHRLEEHSDLVSDLLLADLQRTCPGITQDLGSGRIKAWKNVGAPGGRKRLIDLLLAEPGPTQSRRGEALPDMTKVRLAVENKSVITAHRNRDSRFDDLLGVLETIYREKAEAVIAATVMIGTSAQVLNVPDRVKPFSGARFETDILPRLSTGDEKLWQEFDMAVSANRPDDPLKTKRKFESLPRRPPAHTHVTGFDEILLVPVRIDNVNPPSVDRENTLGIDVDKSYREFLENVCKAYTVRWHP